MAYRADIEIAVRGAQELKRLQNEISATSKLVDGLNKYLENIGSGGIVRSIGNLKSVVADAAAAFNKAALNTEEATLAARKYVTATNELNAGLRERAQLLKQVADEERRAGLARAGIRETTQYGGPIGPGQASSVALSSQLRGRTEQILAERQGRAELNTILQKQFEAEQQLVNSRLDAKAAQVQQVLDKQAAAANESAVQTKKLADRQQEFTERTNAAALAARAQTAEFIRQQRIAKQVADLNASAPAAQLLLPAAAPGAPAMGGGARRRITGPVERLGGARTEDQAAMALRFAQALQEQVRPLSQIDALYAGIAGQAAKLQRIKALPDSAMLNAAARGIKQLELGQDSYNRELKESADRIQQLDRLEESRARRARKLRERQEYFAEAAPAVPTRGGGPFLEGRTGGAISSALIGGGFPLLFGQGAGAAVGGGIGGLAGGLVGGGFGFALSIVGTALGDAADQADQFNRSLSRLNVGVSGTGSASKITADDVKNLAKNLGIAKEEAIKLLESFAGFKDAATTKALAAVFGDDASTMKSLASAKDKAELAQVILNNYEKITGETALQLINQLKTTDSAVIQVAFQKALLDAETKKTEEGLKQVRIQDRILAGLATMGSFMGGGNTIFNPEIFGQQRVAEYRAQQRPDTLRKALEAVGVLQRANRAAESLRPDKGAERAADKAARDAAKEAERVAELVRNRRASAEFIKIESKLQDKIAAAENNRDVVLAARLRGEQNILNIQYEYAKALADEKNPAAQAALIYEAMTKMTAARRDTEREVNRIYVERQRIIEDMINDLDYEVRLKYATTQQERTQIEIERERARLIKEGITDENVLAAIAARRAELNKPILGSDLMRQQIGALSDELTKLTDVGTQVVAIAENIGSAFANSFKGAISGAMTAQEALASFFQSVADRFLDMAAQIIAKWIEMSILNSVLNLFPGGSMGGTSSGPVGSRLDLFNLGAAQYRASGGPVSAGSPYIVGERGPELFVPGRSGNIVPNNALASGGDTVINGGINITVENTGERLSPETQKQIAGQVRTIVLSTLVNERRSGGVLA